MVKQSGQCGDWRSQGRRSCQGHRQIPGGDGSQVYPQILEKSLTFTGGHQCAEQRTTHLGRHQERSRSQQGNSWAHAGSTIKSLPHRCLLTLCDTQTEVIDKDLESTEFLSSHFPGAQAARLPVLQLKPVFACDARTLPRPIVIGLGEECRRAACDPGINTNTENSVISRKDIRR
jgi:hypothetical protein